MLTLQTTGKPPEDLNNQWFFWETGMQTVRPRSEEIEREAAHTAALQADIDAALVANPGAF